MKLSIESEKLNREILSIIDKHQDLTLKNLKKILKEYNLLESDFDKLKSYLYDNEIIVLEDEDEIDEKEIINDELYEGKTNDTVRLYMKDIRNIPLLTREEEKKLAYRIKDGDKSAIKKMIECNARLVISCANKYRDRGLDMADLIEEGNYGLYKAAMKFDPTKDFKFSTYATNWIRQTISRAIADQAKTIRVPVHMHENIFKVKKIERLLTQRLGRLPTNMEIAKEMNDGTTDKKIEEIKRYVQDAISLDSTINKDDDTKLGDFIEDKSVKTPKDYVNDILLQETMKNLLEKELNEREARVLMLRYGLIDGEEKTLEEVGKIFNVTRERVRQIEAKALSKLRATSEYQILKEL